ncbi:MAG TPA: hypothetical protein VNH83_28230 [Bryobacteraceae bacterium]|nr:hypothetical protein [Bryobacteraceae bacterium]
MLAENYCIPVRNRERSWTVESIGGWSTTAETPAPLSFAPMGPQVDLRRPWEEPSDNRCIPIPSPEEWTEPRFVFAPDAATAIERYHASQACPFGKVRLVRYEYRDAGIRYRFENATHGWYIQFTEEWVSFACNGIGAARDARAGLIAFHALLGEIIAYQTSERSGAKDSRIHRAIEEMETQDRGVK